MRSLATNRIKFGNRGMTQKPRSRIALIVLTALLVVAFAVVLYFWRQNVELRRSAQVASTGSQPVRRLSQGDQLPVFSARDTEGHEVKVSARGVGNTLLLIFSPTCDRCEAGMPSWIKLAGKLKQLKASVQVIALSIADSYTTVQHARTAKMPFPVVPFPDVELQKRYGATEVPLTVVVDAQGIVLAVWDKPLDDGEVGDVIESVCPECPERADS